MDSHWDLPTREPARSGAGQGPSITLDAEDDDLFVFHLKVVAALSILYTVLVLAYMVFGV